MQRFPHLPASIRVLTLMMAVGLTSPSAPAADAQTAYRQGLLAEEQIDLFGARDHFRDAIQKGAQMGWKEHTAWFMYINGFHNRECLGLFEEVRGHAADQKATRMAIAHLNEILGQNPPKPRAPVKRPKSLSNREALPMKLQYARELYWSGSPAEAETVLRDLMKRKPDEAALHWELSKVLVAMNRLDEAVDSLHKAIQIRPHEPELKIDCATAEALRNERGAAASQLRGEAFADSAPAHKARARAHHYSGEFIPAAREYEKALALAPHDELVAHGLTECRLRNNDIAGARELLSTWSGRWRSLDWTDRWELERELAANRARAGFGYFHNSLNYNRWEVGADLRMRFVDEWESTFAITQGWFDQKGFSSISRQTAHTYLRYQPDSYWAAYGNVGVNQYDTGWTSVVGGAGLMVRPVSSLEWSIEAEHSDIVDNEPSLGSPFYSMGTTLGGVGGEAVMDALTMRARWIPFEDAELFASYRLAELTDDNRFTELYTALTYTVERMPLVKVSYAFSMMDTEDAAPLYTEGGVSTPYYYDPNNRIMHHVYVEHWGTLSERLSYGTEARAILDQEGGVGTVLAAWLLWRLEENHWLKLDARYFTQNHGWDRNQNQSGHYDAFNLIAIYEYRF